MSGPTGQIGAVVLRRVAVVRRSVLVLSRGKQTKEVPNAKETPLKSEIATPRRYEKVRVQSEKRIGMDWLQQMAGVKWQLAVTWHGLVLHITLLQPNVEGENPKTSKKFYIC